MTDPTTQIDDIYFLDIISRSPRVTAFMAEKLSRLISDADMDKQCSELYAKDESEGTLDPEDKES